jgi:hypothetical protein
MTNEPEAAPARQADSQFGAIVSDNKHLLEGVGSIVPDDDGADALYRKAEVGEPNLTPIPGSEVKAYVKSIQDKVIASLKKQTGSIFETADLLAEAEQKLVHVRNEFKKVWQKAGLKSKSNVENYIRIAKAKYLRKPEFLPHLPVTVGALIDLANSEKWSEEAIKACINARVMSPGCTRETLKKWINKSTPEAQAAEQVSAELGSEQEATEQVPTQVYEVAFVVYVHRSLTKKDRVLVTNRLLDFNPSATWCKEHQNYPPLVIREADYRDKKDIEKRDWSDRYSDQEGTIITQEHTINEAGDVVGTDEWNPLYVQGSNPIRQDDETFTLEPWDEKHGTRPGDLI